MQRYKFTLLLFPFLLFLTLHTEAQTTDEFNLDKVYSIEDSGTISLNSDDANVTIKGSDRNDVRVKIHYKLSVKGLAIGENEEFEMIVEERNGNLNIYEKERDFGNKVVFGSTDEEYRITIEAPRGVSLDLSGDDEDYRISSIDGSISVEADDSGIELNDCNGDEFNIKLDDGELYMDSGKGSLRVNIDDGDVRILNGDFSSIEVETDDSELDITTRLADNGDYTFDLDDGDLRLNIAGGGGEFEIRHDNADISASSEFEQTMDDDDRSQYSLPGGNATVSISTDDGDIILSVI
ncbi:MAG: DUF4097 family beta strand repeat-containing protein [Candidatus Halalkalibacterium sp. M3_1C_030]